MINIKMGLSPNKCANRICLQNSLPDLRLGANGRIWKTNPPVNGSDGYSTLLKTNTAPAKMLIRRLVFFCDGFMAGTMPSRRTKHYPKWERYKAHYSYIILTLACKNTKKPPSCHNLWGMILKLNFTLWSLWGQITLWSLWSTRSSSSPSWLLDGIPRLLL